MASLPPPSSPPSPATLYHCSPLAISAAVSAAVLRPRMRHGVAFSLSSHHFTRRLSLLLLSTAVSQFHLFGLGTPISSRGLERNIIETGIFGSIAEASPFNEQKAVEFAKNDKRRFYMSFIV
ncbi:hypothetical protein RND81_10G162700 [Saponaria officinalis]|uniref:Uncharacterized protein n=1 Tax=Saponaria officinalis TaxID=3572 RepID=A0AAW1I423_SAPOF